MTPGILLIGNHPPPYGGVPTHIESLAGYLVRHGWRVHVLSLKYRAEGVERHPGGYTVHAATPTSKTAKLRLAARQALQWSRFPRLALAGPRESLRTLELWERARRIVVEDPVQVVSAYHVFPSGLVGAWLGQAFSLSLVTTIFGEIYAGGRSFRRRMQDARLVFRSSRRLLSCSRHCAASVGLVDPGRTVDIVYYGVDTGRFSPRVDGAPVRTALGIGSDDPVVLFLARMDREMGLDVLLRAIPAVLRSGKGTKVIVAGRSGELEPAAQELARRHMREVFVVPNVPSDALPAYYAASTVVAAPSVNARACLGLSIAEAMATAKPVIGTAIGGGPEIVEDGKTGLLVPPQDHAALARAILELLDDPVRAARLGARGREVAVARFDADKTNGAMDAIFRDVSP